MRVLLHTGKGGVGKTTLSLATAFGAASHGHRVYVLSTDSAHNLGDALGTPLGSEAVHVTERVTVRELSVLDELDRAWTVVSRWLNELLTGLGEEDDAPADSGVVAEELLAFPGMEELLSLRAIREIEETGEYDVCIVDCAPTGATLRMLRFPDVLRFFMENVFEWKRRSAKVLRPLAKRLSAERFVPEDEVFAAFERLYEDVAQVRQILLDTDRTSARLIVNPARVVVDESRRSFAYLSLYGVATDAVLVNRVLPEGAAGGYFARWAERQTRELAEIERSFPVPIFRLPLQRGEPIGQKVLEQLSGELFGDRDPADFFSRSCPIRLRKRDASTVLEIDLPNVHADDVNVASAGTDLVVHVRDAQRLISLPDSLSGRPVEGFELTDGVLEVSFAP
jgi:arsenite-transporting ATPase